jgi:hypothetical protein
MKCRPGKAKCKSARAVCLANSGCKTFEISLAKVVSERVQCLRKPSQGFCTRNQLDQIQLNCPFDGRPAAIDVEFAVDALGMCADRAQTDHEFTGDLRPRKLSLE